MKVVDGPEAFADEVVKMYQDPAECRRMCEETQKYIREYFSVEAAWKVIEEDFTKKKEIGLGCKVIYGIEYCDKTLPGIYFPAVCSHERKFRQKSGRSVVHGVQACGMRLKRRI